MVAKPLQSLANRPRIWLKIFLAWLLSLIFPLPQLFIFVEFQHEKQPGTVVRMCGSRGYTSPWQRKVYFTFTITYILLVPMAIMLFCYSKIIMVVWLRAKNETPRPYARCLRANSSVEISKSSLSEEQSPGVQRSPPAADSPRTTPLKIHNSPEEYLVKTSFRADVTSSNLGVNSALKSYGGSDSQEVKDGGKGRVGEHRRKSSVHWADDPEGSITQENHQANLDLEESKASNNAAGKQGNNLHTSVTSVASSCHDNISVENPTPSRKESISNSRRLSSPRVPLKRLNTRSTRMSVRHGVMSASKRRALIMTLTVVLSFLFCHVPYFLVNSVRIFSEYRIQLKTLKTVSEFLVLVHSTLNPLLYGLFTLRKRHLMNFFAFLTCRQSQQSQHSQRSRHDHEVLPAQRHWFIEKLTAKFRRQADASLHTSPNKSRVQSRRSFASGCHGVSGTSNHLFTKPKHGKPPAARLFCKGVTSSGVTLTTEAAVNLLPSTPVVLTSCLEEKSASQTGRPNDEDMSDGIDTAEKCDVKARLT